MTHDFPAAALCGIGAASVAYFGIVWMYAKHKDNWSLVDAAWSLAPVTLVSGAVTLGDGWSPRAALVAGLLLLWGVRLATHLHSRVSGGRDREDSRYAEMRKRWGEKTPVKMFVFYQVQALTIPVLALPALLAGSDAADFPTWYDVCGAGLVMTGVIGEALADAQLSAFKATPENRGKLYTGGLRAYTRHPNYFFEWVVWVGFALGAFGAPYGPIAWITPALMYLLLRHGSGVPMLEERALRTKGEAWREYAARTPVFFPRFPKN